MSNPKVDLFSCFCALLFFKDENLLSLLAPLWGKIDICVRELFCTKLNFEQLLFKAFFDAIRIFGSVEREPQTESTFPFLYIILFQRGQSLKLPSSTPGGDRHAPTDFFVRSLMFNNFYLKHFWMRCVFLAVSSPKVNLLSNFCT